MNRPEITDKHGTDELTRYLDECKVTAHSIEAESR